MCLWTVSLFLKLVVKESKYIMVQEKLHASSA